LQGDLIPLPSTIGGDQLACNVNLKAANILNAPTRHFDLPMEEARVP
jgi:hypothetical protein